MKLRTRASMKLKAIYFICSSSIIFLSLGILCIVFLTDSSKVYAAATGDYRSKATGNWNATGTWEYYDGTSWIAAVATPTSTAGLITIQSPHTVTVTANVSANQLIVDAGSAITINNGKSLTLPNSTGTDLTVNGTVTVYGTLNAQASSHVDLSGLIILKAGATGTFTSRSWVYCHPTRRARAGDDCHRQRAGVGPLCACRFA